MVAYTVLYSTLCVHVKCTVLVLCTVQYKRCGAACVLFWTRLREGLTALYVNGVYSSVRCMLRLQQRTVHSVRCTVMQCTVCSSGNIRGQLSRHVLRKILLF